jgi:tRNA_anti-like
LTLFRAGVIIELSGVVKGLHRGVDGKPRITLVAGDDVYGVGCGTIDPQPWASLATGQKVKLKGRWPEKSNAPTLDEVVILEAGPNPAIRMTASQLAKEYAVSPETATKKYNEKYVILDGKFVEKRTPQVKTIRYVYLEGHGKTRVNCVMSPSDQEAADAIKPGEHIQVIGQYWALQEGDDVDLRDCLFIKTAP